MSFGTFAALYQKHSWLMRYNVWLVKRALKETAALCAVGDKAVQGGGFSECNHVLLKAVWMLCLSVQTKDMESRAKVCGILTLGKNYNKMNKT